ncbi:MAG: VOC family protein [Chloroflexota bacterium]
MVRLAFAHHAVTVSDVDRAIAFYRDALGMTAEADAHVEGENISRGIGLPGARLRIARVSFSDNQGVHRLELIQYLSPEGKKQFEEKPYDVGASHLALRRDNVPAAYEELREKDVPFFHPPARTSLETRNYIAFLRDPDGNRIELTEMATHHQHTVKDMARAVAFYRDSLGMEVVKNLEIGGESVERMTGTSGARMKSTHLVPPGSRWGEESIELQQFLHPVGKLRQELRPCDVGCSHVAFGVDDVDEVYRELLAKEVSFISPPFHPRPGSVRKCVHLRDPDGYYLELARRDAWSGPTGYDGSVDNTMGIS